MSAPVQYSVELTSSAGFSGVTITYTGPDVAADRAARRKALLDEAKAWRFVASLAAKVKDGVVADDANFAISEAVRQRFGVATYERTHERIVGLLESEGCEWATGGGVTDEARHEIVLLDLFLALECEDEAAALKPAKRRSRRPHGGAR